MINRRDLLKAAAGVAGTSRVSSAAISAIEAMPLVPVVGPAGEPSQPPAHSSRRRVPLRSHTVHSGELTATFDADDGLPYSYTYKGQRLWGEDEGQPVRAIVCRLAPRDYRTVTARLTAATRETYALLVHFRVDHAGRRAGAFSLRYALDGDCLITTLELVKEEAGFELIEVALPQLMSVREEDGPAWMAEGRRGGSFVQLEASRAYRFPDHEYFGRISPELPVGMVGNAAFGCLMEVTGFHDGTETEIKGTPGSRHATLGCILTHRVHGGRCYNMNDAGSAVCGNEKTPNLLVLQTPRTRFDFFSCGAEEPPWLSGAKIMRGRMPGPPTPYFSDKLLYIVAGRRKIDPEPKSTFAQSEVLVRDVANLTDRAPQVVLLSGWAYDGQDTGFPSEDKINSSLGTDADLRSLIQSGPKLNANITLNVNYDDAYRSSPIFDEAFIARRPDGAIWKSRAWDGEDSFVVGMAKFMAGGWGAKRIAYTVEHFKIRDAILIDAMSWFAVRNDWDTRSPASGYKNLVDGKYKILEEFQARGVAVTSEQLRYPFLGKMAESMDGPGISNCPFGGEAVPLLATIYRGVAIWGTGDGSVNPKRELFWNTRSALWFQADSDRTRMTDFYFLIALPFSKLHALNVKNYLSQESSRTLLLEQDSHVIMDTASPFYSAVWRGCEIAREEATFCPLDDHRIAFYARTARVLRYPIPPWWNPATITARVLTIQGRSAAEVKLREGMIVVYVEKQKPVIVYANEGAIPRQ